MKDITQRRAINSEEIFEFINQLNRLVSIPIELPTSFNTLTKQLYEYQLPLKLATLDVEITPAVGQVKTTTLTFPSHYVGISKANISIKPLINLSIAKLLPTNLNNNIIQLTDKKYCGINDINIKSIALTDNTVKDLVSQDLDFQNRCSFKFNNDEVFGTKQLTVNIPLLDTVHFTAKKSTINRVFSPSGYPADFFGHGGKAAALGIKKVTLGVSTCTLDADTIEEAVFKTQSQNSPILTPTNDTVGYTYIDVPPVAKAIISIRNNWYTGEVSYDHNQLKQGTGLTNILAINELEIQLPKKRTLYESADFCNIFVSKLNEIATESTPDSNSTSTGSTFAGFLIDIDAAKTDYYFATDYEDFLISNNNLEVKSKDNLSAYAIEFDSSLINPEYDIIKRIELPLAKTHFHTFNVTDELKNASSNNIIDYNYSNNESVDTIFPDFTLTNIPYSTFTIDLAQIYSFVEKPYTPTSSSSEPIQLPCLAKIKVKSDSSKGIILERISEPKEDNQCDYCTSSCSTATLSSNGYHNISGDLDNSPAAILSPTPNPCLNDIIIELPPPTLTYSRISYFRIGDDDFGSSTGIVHAMSSTVTTTNEGFLAIDNNIPQPETFPLDYGYGSEYYCTAVLSVDSSIGSSADFPDESTDNTIQIFPQDYCIYYTAVLPPDNGQSTGSSAYSSYFDYHIEQFNNVSGLIDSEATPLSSLTIKLGVDWFSFSGNGGPYIRSDCTASAGQHGIEVMITNMGTVQIKRFSGCTCGHSVSINGSSATLSSDVTTIYGFSPDADKQCYKIYTTTN